MPIADRWVYLTSVTGVALSIYAPHVLAAGAAGRNPWNAQARIYIRGCEPTYILETPEAALELVQRVLKPRWEAMSEPPQ